jgi:DnaJ-class molecular chaperone
MSLDPYKTLGVEKNTSPEEIKKVYRKLARKYHPDLNPNNKQAEAKFKELSEAYDILSDPEKKNEYDNLGKEDFYQKGFGGAGYQGPSFGTDDWTDFFNDILGGGAAKGSRKGGFSFGNSYFAKKGQNREHSLTLDFRTAISGSEVTMDLSLPETCPRCHGQGVLSSGKGVRPCPQCQGAGRITARQTLKTRIPAGVSDGQTVRLKGQGYPGESGGEPGDLLLKITVSPDDVFKRVGQDLYMEQPVSLYECLLGGTVEVNTLTGPANLKLPASTQNGQKFRIKGQGVTSVSPKKAGDLYVTVKVTLPGKLSPEARGLVEKLSQAAPVGL